MFSDSDENDFLDKEAYDRLKARNKKRERFRETIMHVAGEQSWIKWWESSPRTRQRTSKLLSKRAEPFPENDVIDSHRSSRKSLATKRGTDSEHVVHHDLLRGDEHADRLLEDEYDHVVGIDLNEEMAALAREAAPSASVNASDMKTVDLGACFDIIVMLGRVFRHARTDEDGSQLLQNCSAHLHPGGVIVFNTFDVRGLEDGHVSEETFFSLDYCVTRTTKGFITELETDQGTSLQSTRLQTAKAARQCARRKRCSCEPTHPQTANATSMLLDSKRSSLPVIRSSRYVPSHQNPLGDILPRLKSWVFSPTNRINPRTGSNMM